MGRSPEEGVFYETEKCCTIRLLQIYQNHVYLLGVLEKCRLGSLVEIMWDSQRMMRDEDHMANCFMHWGEYLVDV